VVAMPWGQDRGVLGVGLLLLLPWAVTAPCPPNLLAVYKLRLETFWSEERFPKQYPQWRPPAQWSKTVGKGDFTCEVEL
jgi:hypothetical protein